MENTNSLGLLLSFARPCRRLLAASVGLAVLGVASGMVPYFAVSYMIVDLDAGTATPGSLFLFALIALLGQAGRVALGTASTVLSHRAAFAILKGIRTDIAAKLSRMPLGSVIETPSGKLKTLIVDTVEKMEVPLAHLIPELTSNLLVPLFMAAYLFWLDWRMALLALATFPVGLFCYMAMTKDYAERYATVQDAGKGMNAAIVEYINGIEVIKAFNQSSASYGKFVAAVRANRDAMKDWFRATNGYYVAGMAIAPASLITVLPAGVYFHMSGTLDAPAAITCFILSLGLIQPILQALGYTDSLAMMDSTLKEVSDLLGRPEMVRPSNCVPLRGHGIEFDQVSFAVRLGQVHARQAAGQLLGSGSRTHPARRGGCPQAPVVSGHAVRRLCLAGQFPVQRQPAGEYPPRQAGRHGQGSGRGCGGCRVRLHQGIARRI